MRWHCPPDIGFEIRALAVWGRARYPSVTEAPHNTEFYTWMGKKHFCFFQTAETGTRTPNSGVKGSGANHYPRAPAHHLIMSDHIDLSKNKLSCKDSNSQICPLHVDKSCAESLYILGLLSRVYFLLRYIISMLYIIAILSLFSVRETIW